MHGEGDDTGSQRKRRTGPTGSGRREEGGESAGPAPPPSGTHDGGGGGRTGRRGAGWHLRAGGALRPAPPRAPSRPAHWPHQPGGGSRVGGAARRRTRLEPEPEPEVAPIPPRNVHLPPRSKGVSSAQPSAFFPVRAPRCPHKLARRLAAPHFTRWTSEHPRPNRPRGDRSPEVWRTAAQSLLWPPTEFSDTTDPASLLFL